MTLLARVIASTAVMSCASTSTLWRTSSSVTTWSSKPAARSAVDAAQFALTKATLRVCSLAPAMPHKLIAAGHVDGATVPCSTGTVLGMKAPGGRRVVVRSSSIHGRGLFAARDLPGLQALIEYRGQIVPWDDVVADDDAGDGTGVTYFFDRGDGSVIDGARNGNSSRYLNHACRPNCEAVAHGDRIWIHTLEPVDAGSELLLDYQLVVDDAGDPQVRELYACRCGSTGCRGSMLAP